MHSEQRDPSCKDPKYDPRRTQNLKKISDGIVALELLLRAGSSERNCHRITHLMQTKGWQSYRCPALYER